MLKREMRTSIIETDNDNINRLLAPNNLKQKGLRFMQSNEKLVVTALEVAELDLSNLYATRSAFLLQLSTRHVIL